MSDKSDLAAKFMGGIKSLFGKPAEVEEPRPRNTGSLPPVKNGPDTFRSSQQRNTAPLAARPTAPLEQTNRTPEEKAEDSKKRMVFIVKYMKDPNSAPEFKDPKFVYKIITDERTYQTELVEKLQVEYKQLTLGWAGDPEDEEFVAKREELEGRIQSCRDKLSQLFLLLKRVTGIKGKTGGTGFLPPMPEVFTEN